MAIDNGSLNGMYVNGRRVPTVDIQDGQNINIGNPDGPLLTFEVGRQQGRRPRRRRRRSRSRAGQAALAQPAAADPPPVSRPQPYPTGQQPYPSTQQPRYPSASAAAGYTGSQRAPDAASAAASRRQHAAQPLSQPALESATAIGPMAAPRSSEGNLATSMLKILRPGRPGGLRGAGLGQDRPRHRQRHRHPRRAGVAPPRDPGADPAGHRDPRQPQHQRHLRQRLARRIERPAARGRRRSRSATSTWCSRRHAGPPHRDRPRPAAPAAWTCTASRGPSRATRRCCTTSR